MRPEVATVVINDDVAVSDSLYGAAKRYVSRERLEAMLALEFSQLVNQLGEKRGESKCFFAFANTVATRRFGSDENGRGWLGVRFQAHPREEPSEVIIHAHLLDRESAHEQEALGAVGVNLIYGAFFIYDAPERLIASLLDELSRERVEIDMVKFSGPAFAGVDNRLMSLQLVELGLTDAAMFTALGEVVQPSEVLYKKAILVERGSFRPATNLTLDLLQRAMELFSSDPAVRERGTPVVLAEMTLRSLTAGAGAGHEDFLARADILRALGFDVLISRFELYYQLAEYLARYTDGPIGLAVGLPAIRLLIDEVFYRNLAGGVLDAPNLQDRQNFDEVFHARSAMTTTGRVLQGCGRPGEATPSRRRDRPARHRRRLGYSRRRAVCAGSERCPGDKDRTRCPSARDRHGRA